MNTDFKVKLTPQHEEPVYSQSLPTPTNLKDDLLVELALMQEYGVITTLPYSKYSSPIFAQRKPNRKLRILVDLRSTCTHIYNRRTDSQPKTNRQNGLVVKHMQTTKIVVPKLKNMQPIFNFTYLVPHYI